MVSDGFRWLPLRFRFVFCRAIRSHICDGSSAEVRHKPHESCGQISKRLTIGFKVKRARASGLSDSGLLPSFCTTKIVKICEISKNRERNVHEIRMKCVHFCNCNFCSPNSRKIAIFFRPIHIRACCNGDFGDLVIW